MFPNLFLIFCQIGILSDSRFGIILFETNEGVVVCHMNRNWV